MTKEKRDRPYFHFNKCCDRDNPEITAIYGFFCGYKCLSFDMDLKGGEDELDGSSTYQSIGLFYRPKNQSYGYALFRISWEKREGFSVESGAWRKVASFAKKTWNWRKIKELRQQIKETEELAESVCDDPMNGCPGDFAQMYDNRVVKLCNDIYKLEH